MTIATNSTRMGQSGLRDTDPVIPVVPSATRDSAVDAAEVNEATPAEFSLAEEVAYTIYLDSLPPEEALELLVARIQARGAGQALPTPPPAAQAAALQLYKERRPWTAEESEEYERGWQAYIEELKVGEQADAYEDELRDAELADAYYKEQ